MYASVEDFVEGFGLREANMVGDRDQDGAFEPAVLARALLSASQEIDAAVGQRCPLPLPESTAPEIMGLLRQWCLDIARYRLTGSSGMVVTDDIAERYKEAKADLTRVIAGKLLVCRPGAVNAQGDGGLAADDGSAGAAWSACEGRVLSPAQTARFAASDGGFY